MIVRKPTGSGREAWMLAIWVPIAEHFPRAWRLIAWLCAEMEGRR